MKKLIISVKSPGHALSDFKSALKKARKGKLKKDHFEVSFDSKKDFDRFVKNLSILSAILVHKPQSIYELAKTVGMDVSNLNKIVAFFEAVGAVTIKWEEVGGRMVKRPVVEYTQVEFDLAAS